MRYSGLSLLRTATTYGCGTAPAFDRLPPSVAKQYVVFGVPTVKCCLTRRQAADTSADRPTTKLHPCLGQRSCGEELIDRRKIVGDRARAVDKAGEILAG